MRTTLSLALVTMLAACSGGKTEAENPEPTAPPPATTTPPVASAPTATPTTTAAPAEPTPPKPDVEWTGFATPESVLYDAEGDRYFVSNINGKPLDADNNGFISELTPDGKVKTLKLIEGGQNKVTLHAPKGMALVAGVLYVADIDTVRMFDIKGAPVVKGEIKIAGSTFLADMAAGTGKDAPVYVTDLGMKQGASDFEPTGTDAVYIIEKGKAKALVKSTDLNRPNGVVITPKGVLVNTFGADEVYRLGKDGKKEDVTKTPKGGLDGLAFFKDEVIVSSWQGQALYKGPLGGKLVPFLENLKAPADFAVDTKRNLVVVPRFLDNTVQGFRLSQ